MGRYDASGGEAACLNGWVFGQRGSWASRNGPEEPLSVTESDAHVAQPVLRSQLLYRYNYSKFVHTNMRIVDAASRLFAYAREYGLYKTTIKLTNRIKKICNNLILSIGPLDTHYYDKSVKMLEEVGENRKNAEKIIDEANKFDGFGLYKKISPQQDKYEIKGLAEVVNKKKPSTIVEIGTAEGGTLYLWARYIESAEKIVSVDLGVEFEKRHKFFKKFNEEKELTFVEGYSQEEETFKRVFKETNMSVDFLFIDGDHSYEGVKGDFEVYSDIVNGGGVIAFHDIIETGYENMGVPRLWREIKGDYNSEEIINPKSEQGGIGILHF